MNLISEDYFKEQAEKVGLYVKNNLCQENIPEEIIKLVPDDIAVSYKIVPYALEDQTLCLATYSVETLKCKDVLADKLNCCIRLVNCDRDNVTNAIRQYYGTVNRAKPVESYNTADTSPQVQSVLDMLQNAASVGASDIHLLPTSNGMHVDFRVDGHLIDYSSEYEYRYEDMENITNIIKQMDTSNQADVSRKNMPDAGSFYFIRGNTIIDVRIATVPVGNLLGWQKINLRLLPQSNKRVSLDDIGYSYSDLSVIKQTLYKSASGLFLNSGPTGSGKTTSLYAQIYYVRDVKNEPLNIMTIDNPIEIREELFSQVQVREASNEANNLTAKKILKVGLRSDPDIFLYNEIRDAEDATVAMEASSTGHRVFSTVHAADCIRTISRLLDLNVSRSTLLSELKLIISQRLVARLCPKCSRPHNLTDLEKSILHEKELKFLTSEMANLREKGSPEAIRACSCKNGYVERTAIAEYVVFDMELRDALLNLKSFREIAEILHARGFYTMWQKALQKVKNGEIELQEAIQIIGKD